MSDHDDGAAPARSDTGVALRMELPARPEELRRVRQALTVWGRRVRLDPDTLQDLVLATNEALANAVDHAYRDQVGTMWVFAERTAHEVRLEVCDAGTWRPPADPGCRGRGLLLIRSLADEAEVHGDIGGTTVRMRWRVRA